MHTHTHIHTHAHTGTHIDTHTRACMRTCTHTQTRTHMYTHTHTYAHTCTHTCTCTHTRTHTRSHAHTQQQLLIIGDLHNILFGVLAGRPMFNSRMIILDDQARQQMTLHFQLSLQCNVSPITGFVRHTAAVCLTKPVMGETLH